jgi:hypothetical protein
VLNVLKTSDRIASSAARGEAFMAIEFGYITA